MFDAALNTKENQAPCYAIRISFKMTNGTRLTVPLGVGDKKPEQNPGSGFCGTYAPIWMRGSHPTTDNVVKDVTACGAAPFAFPIGCAYSFAIKVIKCGKFFLYRLKEPKLCYLAYCAGKFSFTL
jgi:hypothetical protein